jgi:hypothetical protein
MSAVAIGAVVGSFFTDIYTEAPVRAVALVIIYVALAVRLWRLAARRSQR